MSFSLTQFLLSFFLVAFCLSLKAQVTAPDTSRSLQSASPNTLKLLSLEPATTFNKKRFWISAGTGAALYAGTSIALWNAWYKDFPLSGFHTFNDLKEWEGMDKGGHFFSTYMESNYVFQGARWTGMERRKAMWTAAGVGMGIQTTIEIMDGFSEEWGFSFADMAFNTLGAGLFVAQEMMWQEQRILLKVSATRPDYPTSPIFSLDGESQTSLKERATELYGNSPFEVILKDYNATTYWYSFNLADFAHPRPSSKFPRWLNVAFGYGANNIFGGFDNNWTNDDGAEFSLDEEVYPRYLEFYLSPDIDLTKIPSRHRWLKFILGVLNWMKFPAPAIEINTLGEAKFHPIRW